MMYNSEVDIDEKWIEEEIQKELDQLDVNSDSNDDELSLIKEIHTEKDPLLDSIEASSFSRSRWLFYIV